MRLPSTMTSLSVRLLGLTIVFAMIAEVLIYVPSIARFRLTYLEERIAASHLATLSLEASPDHMISPELERRLLSHAQVSAVVLKREEARMLVLGDSMPPRVDGVYDLGVISPVERNPFVLMLEAFETLLAPSDRIIRVIGPTVYEPGTLVDIIMKERPMQSAMYAFSARILGLSLVISVITAGLVYLSLHFLMVRPMGRITQSMVGFRKAPEDQRHIMARSQRADEIGVASRELAAMQEDLRTSLRQKTRLAALGTAVSKINHDLRNILSTAQLMSDRLAESEDPEVRRVTPIVFKAIDRAVDLCTQTLRFGKLEEPAPVLDDLQLRDIVDDVGASLGLTREGPIAWDNFIANGLIVHADRDQLYRVFLNLARNAVDAIGERGPTARGRIAVSAERGDDAVIMEVADDGPGLAAAAREHLFEPFAGGARSGGAGLGLSIVRELMRANGGEIVLAKSDDAGATFRLKLPTA